MACKGNCAGCGDVLAGGQKSWVAYIQPCGAGPSNDTLNAMTDGDYPAVKVTNMQRQIRGSRTAVRKRQSDGTSKICYYKEDSPGDNTISLEFSECGCGGYDADELNAEGTFDLYQMQRCCGSADLEAGWSKMKVHRCISFTSMTQSDMTSFSADDDEEVTRTYEGSYVEDYTLYPLTFGDITTPTGLDIGQQIRSFTFAESKAGCTTNCKDSCADAWYATTDAGKVIYKTGIDATIQLNAIPGYVDNNNAQIGQIGDRLIVAQTGGYWETTLDDSGNPTTWNYVAITTGVPAFTPLRITAAEDELYLVGANGTGGQIVTINSNATFTTQYLNATANTQIFDLDACGSRTLAVGASGVVLHGTSCGNLATTTISPTNGQLISAGIRPGGEYWIGDNSGNVWHSSDSGVTWTSATLPANVGIIRDIEWADSGIGYIVGSAGILYTVNGGETWTKASSSGSRIPTPPASSSNLYGIQIPCCKNKVKQMNSAMVFGATAAGVGALWEGTISQC